MHVCVIFGDQVNLLLYGTFMATFPENKLVQKVAWFTSVKLQKGLSVEYRIFFGVNLAYFCLMCRYDYNAIFLLAYN